MVNVGCLFPYSKQSLFVKQFRRARADALVFYSGAAQVNLTRNMVLSLVVKGYSQTQMPVRVPESASSKARALVRQGYLQNADGASHFIPTPLGRLLAEDIDG